MSGKEGGKFMEGQVCLFSSNSEIALTGPLSRPAMRIPRAAGHGRRAGTPRPKITAETWDDGSYSKALEDTALCGRMRWC